MWKWYVCGILFLATLLNYMDRQALAITLPELKVTYALDEGRIGYLEGYFGYAFAVGSIVFGLLVDRVGPRILYPIVLAGWSLMGVATSAASEPWVKELLENEGDPPGTAVFRWLLICRTLLGLFEAGHWPCALITARLILSAKDRPLGNGILQSGAAIGAIIVPLYVMWFELMGLSWQFTFWSIGVAGLFWIPLWFWLIPRGVLQSALPVSTDIQQEPLVPNRGLLVRRLIALGIVVTTLTVSWQFLRAWLPLYLQDHRKFPPRSMQFCVSGYFIAADIGCILAGAFVRALSIRYGLHGSRMLGYVLFTCLTASAAVVPFVDSDVSSVALLMIAGAGILGLHPFYYSLTQELPARNLGMLMGCLAAVGWVASSYFQIQIGERIRVEQNYKAGLMIAGLAPIIGLVALLILWGRTRKPPQP